MRQEPAAAHSGSALQGVQQVVRPQRSTGFESWSSELFRIYGLRPGGKAPSIPEYMTLVHPEDREFVAQQIRKMLANHS